ncbi:hypothetical protein [Flavobacterium lipolyticum]|uniref:Lipoprotein n=1 Tax=Flavobacterium lipolyticum TaxID=2893754 RepID=A0ABS8LWQ7_9FLAO|nr:hypothetical protein [Flavobacterium sp. F-126]MCC9016974.1 hypothetical protein [Flavobacterium sp. F-126]
MKKIIYLITVVTLISCNKNNRKEKTPKTKEKLALEFCKLDVKANSPSPSTIKYDSLLTDAFKISKNTKYYNKDLDDVYGMIQINDSTSEKWQVHIYFDSENKYGAKITNNVIYILKENELYSKDSIMNEQFIILSKRDQNKLHENL